MILLQGNSIVKRNEWFPDVSFTDSICLTCRTVYRVTYTTTYRRARSSKLHFICCPGWKKEKGRSSFGCLKRKTSFINYIYFVSCTILYILWGKFVALAFWMEKIHSHKHRPTRTMENWKIFYCWLANALTPFLRYLFMCQRTLSPLCRLGKGAVQPWYFLSMWSYHTSFSWLVRAIFQHEKC